MIRNLFFTIATIFFIFLLPSKFFAQEVSTDLATFRCDTAENCNGEKEKEKEILEKAVIQVHPNPFVSFIEIIMEVADERNCYFQLYGIDGKLILEENHFLSLEEEIIRLKIPEASLAVGSYVLLIRDKGRLVHSQILIKASDR